MHMPQFNVHFISSDWIRRVEPEKADYHGASRQDKEEILIL